MIMEKPVSLEQREIEDAIAELKSSKGCNEHEHAKIVRASVLSIRMHETSIWQNQEMMRMLTDLSGAVAGNKGQISHVSKMSRNEEAAQERRDKPSFLNGGISIKGFKAWGAPARILTISIAAAIIILAVWLYNKAPPPDISKMASDHNRAKLERVTQ